MTLPSDLVEGGTKGKALTLLHAWKDQLWEMGGEERPPRPRLLRGGSGGEGDTDEEWVGEESETAVGTQSEIFKNENTPRELSREGERSGGMNGSCR